MNERELQVCADIFKLLKLHGYEVKDIKANEYETFTLMRKKDEAQMKKQFKMRITLK